MLLEAQRFIHEDLERLEQGIADRMGEEPKQVRFNCLMILSVNTERMLISFSDPRSP